MKGVKGSARDGEKKPCLFLEDYIDFCDDPLRPDLIIEQLNHIIFMHGFIRMHRRHKAEILSTLEAMELVRAPRTTVEESISRCTPLAVEDVRRDLEAIGWQECPVGSVQSVGLPVAAEDAIPIPIASAAASSICCSSTATPASAAKKVRKRKRAKALPLLAMGPAGGATL